MPSHPRVPVLAVLLWAAAQIIPDACSAQGGLVFGLPKTDDFAFTTTTPTVDLVIPIEPGPRPAALRVRPFPLSSTTGAVTRVEHALKGPDGRTLREPATITASSAVSLHIRAVLPAPGTYRGGFTAVVGANRTPRGYTITWQPRVRPVELAVSGSVPARAGSEKVVVPFTLRDTTGSPAVVRPVLDSLRRVHGGEIAFAVAPKRVAFYDGADTTPAESVALLPRRTRPMRLVLDEAFASPGTYAGTLRVEGDGMAAPGVPLRFYVRRTAWAAAAVIALGIILAELIRRYSDSVRPRLDQQRRVSRLIEALDELTARMGGGRGLAGGEEVVVDALRGQLARLYAAVAAGSSADADGRIADLELRLRILPEWVNMERHATSLPARLQEDARRHLAPARDYLVQDGVDEKKRTAATQALESAAAKFEDAHSRLLGEQITAFEQRVVAERGALPPDAPPTSAFEAVAAHLAAARKHLEAGGRSEAEGELDAARHAYADVAAHSLRARLAGASPPWAESRWEQVRVAVDRELDATSAPGSPPEDRLAAVERAQRLFLEQLAPALAGTAAGLLTSVQNRENLRLPLEAALAHAKKAQALSAFDMRAATQEFTKAESSWSAYLQASGTKLSGGERAQAAGLPEPLPPGSAAGPLARRVAPVPVYEPSHAIGRRIAVLDLFFSGLVAALAIFLGVRLLWEPSLTWGSFGDLAAAFLWGLGLQQVGNESFRGLAHFMGRFRAGTPPAGGA